jgi:hypothetical protein
MMGVVAIVEKERTCKGKKRVDRINLQVRVSVDPVPAIW